MDNLELVGIDGAIGPDSKMGRACPVVRNTDDGLYSKLANGKTSSWYTQSEVESFAEVGRLTLFSKPEIFFTEALAAYITHDFIDILERDYTGINPLLNWTKTIIQDKREIIVCFASMQELSFFFDRCTAILMDKACKLIQNDESKDAEKVSRLALDSSISEDARLKAYKLYGSILMHIHDDLDMLFDLYRLFFSGEFTKISFEEFRCSCNV